MDDHLSPLVEASNHVTWTRDQVSGKVRLKEVDNKVLFVVFPSEMNHLCTFPVKGRVIHNALNSYTRVNGCFGYCKDRITHKAVK